MPIMETTLRLMTASRLTSERAPAGAAAPALAKARLPRHIAIVMDGNGRWATNRGLPRLAGHLQGAEAVREAVRGCAELGVQVLTLYAFSAQNWSRPAQEVDGLMKLLKRFLASEAPELAEKGIRLRAIGFRDALSPEVQDALVAAERLTASGTRLELNLAVNYGAQEELAHAARLLAEQVQAGALRPEQIDTARLAGQLFTRGQPPVDLLIRTAGEQRVSNFMLFQAAYAELIFLPALWPEFGRAQLQQALHEYARRRRTFGGLDEKGGG